MTDNPASLTCEGFRTYTYTYKDCADLEFVWTFTYTIEMPTTIAAVPADDGREVPCAIDAAKPGAATITDVCGRDIVPTYLDSVAAMNTDGTGTVTHKYTYTDCAGHDSIWRYVYTVNPDVFTPVADKDSTVKCPNMVLSQIAMEANKPTITVCGSPVEVVFDSVNGNFNNSCGDSTYYYHYVVNGITYEWKYTFNVLPDDFTIPSDDGTTVACPSSVTEPIQPTVTDYCDSAVTITLKTGYPTATPPCEGSVEYVYTYADCAGHEHDWTYTYTIEHTSAPEAVDYPAISTASTVACLTETESEPATPTVNDVCGTLIPKPEPVTNTFWETGRTGCEGKVTYTYTYKDCADKEFVWVYTYNILDNVAPTFTAPDDITIYADANCIYDASIAQTGDVTDETDNCSTGLEATYTDAATDGDCAGKKVISRTWSLVDNCGNHADNQIQTITVLDTIAPAYTRPADTLIAQNGSCNATSDTIGIAKMQPTAISDNCDANPIVSYTDVTTTEGCVTTIKRNWRVTDACGNISWLADSVQTITIKDTTAPTYTRPADTLIAQNGSCNATSDTTGIAKMQPTAVSDNCNANPTVSFTDVITTEGCVTTIKRNWRVTDVCGNISWLADSVQTITIKDTTKPLITGTLEPIVLTGCGESDMPTATNTIEYLSDNGLTISDNCTNNADLVVTSDTPALAGECNKSTTRTYRVTDACGNHSEATQTITINYPILSVPAIDTLDRLCEVDATAPTPNVITICGTDYTAIPYPNATDYRESTVGANGKGFVTYNYRYTTCTGDYDWHLTYRIEPDVFSLPANDTIAISCPALAVESLYTKPEVSVCGVDVIPVYSDSIAVAAGGCGIIVHRWTYNVNAEDYVWRAVFNVTPTDFDDLMPANAEGTVNCTVNALAAGETGSLISLPVVLNHCDTVLNAPVLKAGYPTVAPACNGDIEFVYTYTDCAGHNHDWTYTYHIEQPDFAVTPATGSATVECAADALGAGESGCAWTLPTVTSACGETLIPIDTTISAAPACEGEMAYTYTYRDCANHVHTYVHTYTIERQGSVAINSTGITDKDTVICPSLAMATFTVPTATSSCGEAINGVLTDSTYTEDAGSCNATKTYTYTYTDCSGNNSDTWTFTYRIELPEVIAAVPDNGTGDMACAIDAVIPGANTIQDACGRNIVPVYLDSTAAMNTALAR